MTKSYVTLEQHVCPVCGVSHDTGALLLDRRLKERFDRNTVTGLSLCPEHKRMHDEGYLALVEIEDPPNLQIELSPETAVRTGNIAHLRRTTAEHILQGVDVNLAFLYIDKSVIPKLMKLMEVQSVG